MINKEGILDVIIEQGMLPLFYHEDKNLSLDIIKTVYNAGVRTLEYTNRGPAALENFKFLKENTKGLAGFYLGIGTIKNAKEAQDFVNAGADYIVAPTVNEEVAKVASDNNLLWVPGCMTPTEISKAQTLGALLIKLFPANILGPGFMGAIRELFAGQKFIPTGGVEIEENNLKTWFKSGVCAVGMGSKMITKEIMDNRDLKQLEENTVKALSLIKQSK
ncbi:bifunctional 4-hydroxy-2-oxoglutarate aldolase/2-dehydro-3-deoxy-phosphogluconate aldolase [Pseudopedobacter beijingensis]|uniref:Bifunctional 4-hydroxy-2-oxoglutarate aldolase/2-dehydro-3-deoxy-phosphogluconate aldolase n=1 Tax=Pseudopedobacter beijingensis TaxID=1207056 RepID=A0ABW4IA51_9SPHI